jgi:Ribosomal protein L2
LALKKYKPVTPGRRFGTVSDFSVLTKKKPEKSLTESLSQTGGRITAESREGMPAEDIKGFTGWLILKEKKTTFLQK